MVYLRKVIFPKDNNLLPEQFPFNLPIIRNTSEIIFESHLTFLIGENGSGKSTILEALGAAINLPTIGSTNVASDETLVKQRELADKMRLIWNKRKHRGFFLRAEDFFGFTKYVSQLRSEMKRELERVEEEYQDHSHYAKMMARVPFSGTLDALKQKYGENLDAYSHGESFLTIFQSRFVPEGIYLLDEPETPLSPQNCLSLLLLLKKLIKQKSQIIIATHSPILMSFPGATILSFDSGKITKIEYENVDHVQLTKSFLDNPERFFNQLFKGL